MKDRLSVMTAFLIEKISKMDNGTGTHSEWVIGQGTASMLECFLKLIYGVQIPLGCVCVKQLNI